MNPVTALLNNYGNPHGWAGRAMLRLMNAGAANSSSRKWARTYIDFQNFQADFTCLDIGCGGGANMVALAHICPEAHIYGIDPSEEAILFSKHLAELHNVQDRVHLKLGTAEDLPFADNSFDLICAFETIYFWLDLDQAFREVRRVLRKHGQFVIMHETSEPDNRWAHMIKDMHVYSGDDIRTLLEKHCFLDIEVHARGEDGLTVIATRP